jgi:hypothetical protein
MPNWPSCELNTPKMGALARRGAGNAALLDLREAPPIDAQCAKRIAESAAAAAAFQHLCKKVVEPQDTRDWRRA